MKRPREATLKFEAKYDVGFVDNDGDVHPVIVNDDSREEIVSTGPDGPIKDPPTPTHPLSSPKPNFLSGVFYMYVAYAQI